MILMDWPLFGTAILFFILSWPYGWGLLHFFRDNFHWDKAAVVGILFVTSGTYTFVWTVRQALGYPLTPDVYSQCVYDLFVVFAAALPGMIMVRCVLVKDSEETQPKTDDKETTINIQMEPTPQRET